MSLEWALRTAIESFILLLTLRPRDQSGQCLTCNDRQLLLQFSASPALSAYSA